MRILAAETWEKHGGSEFEGTNALSEGEKGALEEAGVMGALRQAVEYSFDLIRLFPVLPGVFF